MMCIRRAGLAVPVLVAMAVVGPSAACTEERVPVDFALPQAEPALGTAFLATPWPSDLMVKDADHGGGLDLAAFPNPYGSQALDDVIRLFETGSAYSATGTLYFRVPGGVDESSLPADAAASLTDGAAMFLVETATLQRIPLVWQHYAEGTSFLPAGTVAAQPLLGAVPQGRFALVVTANARAASGVALGASDGLRVLLTCGDLPSGARAVDCSPYQKLIADLGLTADTTALVQMVTPLDSSSGLVDAARVVRDLTPSFTVTTKRPVGATDDFVAYDGTMSLAQLQAGDAPFDNLDFVSGGFVLGDDGLPVVQRTEEVPFLLTVPRQPQPPGGYCVVINGHGTGGDLESGLGNDARAEAWQIAQAGCAMLSISEPLHRTRAGYRAGQEEILTFNFFNPLAGRDNWRQSAVEKVQLVSLAQVLVVPGAVSGGGDIRFDGARVSYFGHSQGGIAGALFVAVEDRIPGAFLSGAGGGFQVSLVEKVDPVAIKNAIKAVVFIPEDEDIDLYHPVITLLQTYVDPADPINYGPLWRNRSGPVPHLIVTSGLIDTYTPPSCHRGLAGAFRLPVAEPVSEELEVLELLGVPHGPALLNGNLETVDGAPLTAGVLQYPDDGHFAVFNNPGAQAAMRGFFRSLQSGVPSVKVQ